jgi:hypothetical protein
VGLLAADASAADVQYKNGHLRIKFSQDNPEIIQVTDAGPLMVAVVADEGLGAGPQLFGIYLGVTNISVKGSRLPDVFLAYVTITGNLTIKGGAGDDDVYVGGIVSRNVKISLGAGDDILEGLQTITGGSYTAKGGAGDDRFSFQTAMLISSSMSLDLGKGDPTGNEDVALFNDAKTIQKTLSIKLSKQGDQDVVLENLTADKVIIRGGKGDNELDLTGGGNVIDEVTTQKVEATLLP